MNGFITSIRKGTSEKTGNKYHVIEMAVQDEETGAIGILKHFLDPDEQADNEWITAKVGTPVEVETEERKDGLNSYTNVVSAKPFEGEVTIKIS